MNTKKQKLLIEYLISSVDVFALCNGIIRPEYFDPEFRNAVSFIQDYYNEYSSLPQPHQIEAETEQKFSIKDIRVDEIEYCATEIEKFCKQEAMRAASLAMPKLIKEEKYGEAEALIKEALLISLHNNLGLRYFKDIDSRIERMVKNNSVISTGWRDLDDALFGGISRKELLLVSANSGGGKSITLANLGYNFVKAGLNVLYISLELSEDVVAQRFDTMFTGISRREWMEKANEVSLRLKKIKDSYGNLDIVKLPSATNANNIRAFLKKFHLYYNMMPDLLILDYLDKMSPNEKVSADNVFEKDRRCTEQLRDIGIDFNMVIATASQLNRSAINAVEKDHSHIAGGMSKINESDTYFSVELDDKMRAMGECNFLLQKTRNSDGVGKRIYLKWNSKYLRIEDKEEDSLFINKNEKDEFQKTDNDKIAEDFLNLLESTR